MTVECSDDESLHSTVSTPYTSVAYERPRTSQNQRFEEKSASCATCQNHTTQGVAREVYDRKDRRRVQDPFERVRDVKGERVERVRRWMRQLQKEMTDIGTSKRVIAEMKLDELDSTTTRDWLVWEKYWDQLCTNREERDLYEQIEDLKLSELGSVMSHPDAIPTYYSRLPDVISTLKEKEDLHISASDTIKDALCTLVEHMSECGTLSRMLNAKKWRGEKLTLSEFPEQLRRLAVTLEMVVQMNAHHYGVEVTELFSAWARPGAWNSDEEVRARLILLAKARVDDSAKFIVASWRS